MPEPEGLHGKTGRGGAGADGSTTCRDALALAPLNSELYSLASSSLLEEWRRLMPGQAKEAQV